MFRVTSLTEMPDARLNRLIKLLALALLIGIVAFVAFYAIDRFRAPAPSIAEREVSMLEQAVRDDPSDIASRGRLADVYVAMARYDDAITLYNQILETGKADRAAYAGRGRALDTKGDLEAAKADYDKVVELSIGGEMANVDAVLSQAYYGLGSIALRESKAQDAVGFLEKSLAIKRTDADTLNLLGAAYVKAGTADKAIEPLRQAILFVPAGWADPYASLAEAYGALGQPELAEWASAMAAGQSGDVAGATKRLEAIADGKAGLDARIGLGLLAETSGDDQAAAGWYQKALELDATSRSAQLGLSRVTGGAQGHPSILPSPSAEGSN